MDENDKDEAGYLILTRRPNETLRIGENILLRVLSVGRNVRINIEAPADQRILRSELLDRQPPSTVAPAPTSQAAEPRQAHAVEAATEPRRQPVVRYRRRRKLMTLEKNPRSGRGSPGGD